MSFDENTARMNQEEIILKDSTEDKHIVPSSKDVLNGYGCQQKNQHPLYRTTSKEYGWFPPDYYTAPNVYYPKYQKFSNHLAAAGMYRNYSLNTVMDSKYK